MTEPTLPLAERLAQYTWYHAIDLGDGIHTTPRPDVAANIAPIWDFIRAQLTDVDLDGLRVLDVGCRDGLWAIEAERRGAARVVAFDSGLSRGALDVVLPHLESQVEMTQLNVNDLAPDTFGRFDVVFCFGVLYHLRYPFWALQRLVDVLEVGGRLLIESGMLATPDLERAPLLFCPTRESPYDYTSCTFFNRAALDTTLESMGMQLGAAAAMEGSRTHPAADGSQVERQFLAFEKVADGPPHEAIEAYWRGTHQDDEIHAALREGVDWRRA